MMETDVAIKNGMIIPEHEIEFSFSRSGGAGGQHVNKTESRVTASWNVRNTQVLNEEQKERVLKNLHARLTDDGVLVVHNSESRSQQHNKERALLVLVQLVRKALYVPKKRMKTRVPKGVKEARLQEKSRRSVIKKMRSKKIQDE